MSAASNLSLPLCAGPRENLHVRPFWETFLYKYEFLFLGYEVQFKDEVPSNFVCSIQLTEKRIENFISLINKSYWYQVDIDGLSALGNIGESLEGNYEIFTHKRFDIEYNGKQIIKIHLTDENRLKVQLGTIANFTYEVHWKPTTATFDQRIDEYPVHTWRNLRWWRIIVVTKLVILCGYLIVVCIRRKDRQRSEKGIIV